jgi:hypothetical protein
MNSDQNLTEVYKTLHTIYQKHRKKHLENPDSKQMCCMWSSDDPPDVLEDTETLLDLEEAFDISIDEDEAFELYEMMLDHAAKRIQELMALEQ